MRRSGRFGRRPCGGGGGWRDGHSQALRGAVRRGEGHRALAAILGSSRNAEEVGSPRLRAWS